MSLFRTCPVPLTIHPNPSRQACVQHQPDCPLVRTPYQSPHKAKRIDALGELRNSAGTKLEGTSQTYTLSLTDDEGGEQPEMSYTFIDHCYEEVCRSYPCLPVSEKRLTSTLP